MNKLNVQKILIADDHVVFCKGMEVIIRPAFEAPIFTFANSLGQLLSEIKNDEFDLLLLDVNFMDGNLTEVITTIKESVASAKIIVFSSELSFIQYNLLKDNVHAIINKQLEITSYVGIIKNVFENDEFISSPVNKKKVDRLNLLTERELDVIDCMLDGYGNKEIVNQLGLKESTISTLRKRILDKLELTNNVELLNYFNETIFN
jgi:DNA-binding NarL/FixJ family response regulator